MNVYAKLNAARQEFHTLQLKKTGLNKFAGYSYFELGDFLIPALSVFEKHGLCAFISFGKDLATMTIVDADAGDDQAFITITSPMAEALLKGCHPIQNLGAVETYTRRYLWVAALEIVEHDALDSSQPLGSNKDASTAFPARPKDDELDLDESTLATVKEVAKTIETMVENGKAKDAVNYYKAAGMVDDMHIAFQNNISSKTRTALRKAQEEMKVSK